MPELAFSDFDQSRVLKTPLHSMERLRLAKLMREERPTLSLKDALYAAHLVLEANRLGVIRGSVIKVNK